jgi:hypothetical protein
MTIYQALAATGAVRFRPNGRIAAVDGVVVTGNIDAIVRLNGRRIPESRLNLPVQRGDTIGLELVVRGAGIPREDEEFEADTQRTDEIESNYELIEQNAEEVNVNQEG